jgi:hypothetical protein
MRRTVLALLTAVVVASSGCSTISNLFGGSDTSPSPSATTDAFGGTLVVGGSSFFTFTVSQAGSVSVTLTSLAGTTPVGVGIGTPNGTTSCTVTTSSQSTTAGASAQVTANENPGTYCVSVFDPGTLQVSTTFAVSVVHP